MNTRNRLSTTLVVLGLILTFLQTSCKDDNEIVNLMHLNTTKVNVDFGEEFSVKLSLEEIHKFDKINIVKTNNGKVVESYQKTLDVKNTVFPYTFTERVTMEDENGTIVYSFYGLDASGNKVDAVDAVLYIKFGQMFTLLKYDWKPTIMMISIYDFADAALKDNVYRLNQDNSLQFDWGTALTGWGLEVLESHCAWKTTTVNNQIDSVFFIKYNIMSSAQIIEKYKLVELKDKTMKLQSTEDWSWLGLSNEEAVTTTYEAIPKSPDFTPFRGKDPADYLIPACNPGSY